MEAKVPPRPSRNSEEMRSIIGHFKTVPDYRARIGIDGKEPLHGSGDAVVTAVTSSTHFYLGSAIVPTEKTNEIPVARALFEKLNLEGRIVSLDALHTQTETPASSSWSTEPTTFSPSKRTNPPFTKPSVHSLTRPPLIFFPEDRPLPTEKLKATGPITKPPPTISAR